MAAEHIIKSYDEELNRLNGMIVEMGGLAESQLAAAIDAVARRDSELAARVIEGDERVDQLELEMDNLAIRLLALRQPMARDLREIVVALKIASDLERIGDYATNVAKRRRFDRCTRCRAWPPSRCAWSKMSSMPLSSATPTRPSRYG
jgi:phosphate transport system protein